MADSEKLIPAATILLVRDEPDLQVLMVERHHQIDFASGALVFPGGKAQSEDSADAWADAVDGAVDPAARAFMIAAVREGFEESAILLARRRDARGPGRPLASAADCAVLHPLRDAIARGEASFLAAVRDAGLVLALDALTPFAHWITPKGMPKRFDTHFYLAVTPEDQEEACDGGEAVDAVWIAPHDALAQAKSGARTIIFPTRMNVELLAKAANSSEALAQAKARRIVTVEPQIVREDGAMMLTIPAEAGYSVTREPLDGNRP